MKRAARTSGDFYVPAEPKVYFVIRIRGQVYSIKIPFFPKPHIVSTTLHPNLAKSSSFFVYFKSTAVFSLR